MNRVLISTMTDEEARHVDRLLWCFREQSFIPHGRLGEVAPALNPVLITADANAGDEHDVLINLSAEVPPFLSRFERVIECVDNDPDSRQASRQRYRLYRDKGYPLKTHNID